MSTKQRTFTLHGVTNKLVDGQPRKVTLVAIVRNEDIKGVHINVDVKHEGKKTITTRTAEEYIKNTNTTISFGLAVVSPIDERIHSEAVIAYNEASLKKDKDGMAAAAKYLELVSDSRGVEIATGKALKPKSALTIIHNTDKFFNHGLIKLILADKLKHICQDPDSFIRIAIPRAVGSTTLTANEVEGGRRASQHKSALHFA